jgi:hypothetical protein
MNNVQSQMQSTEASITARNERAKR